VSCKAIVSNPDSYHLNLQMWWAPTISNEVSRRCRYLVDMKIMLIKVGRYLFPEINLNDNNIIKLRIPSKVVLVYGTYKI